MKNRFNEIVRYVKQIRFLFLGLVLCILSCSQENEVQSKVPTVNLQDARNITFEKAELQCIVYQQSGKIDTCYYVVGTSPLLESNVKKIGATVTKAVAKIVLTSLEPNTTYYYKLTVSNGYSSYSSEIKKFTTSVCQPPLFKYFGITSRNCNQLQFKMILNDSTYKPKDLQLKYYWENDSIIQTLPVKDTLTYTVSLNDLYVNTTYSFIAQYANKLGTCQSKKIQITLGDTAIISKQGNLGKMITERQKYTLKKLKIKGIINQSDLNLLRDMSGISVEGNNTQGKLETLDLSNALYDGQIYKDLVNYFFFPKKLTWGTTSLKKLIMPDKSQACNNESLSDSHLECIETTYSCTSYKSIDGVLFTREDNKLIAYPPYKVADEYTVPAGTRIISYMAFYGACKMKSISFPASLASIECEAFMNYHRESTSAGRLVIPETVSYMCEAICMNGEFKDVKVLARVQTLGTSYFQNCLQLESVTLGSYINFIQADSFDNCPSLKEIHCLSSTPPEFDNDNNKQFSKTDKSSCVIYVPKGSKATYSSAKIWSTFTHIVEE